MVWCAGVPILLRARPRPGTGTLNFDTDRDGLLDVIEDTNGNGLVDAGETDRLNPDTDGDGFSDGEEVSAGTDPLDDASFPVVADGDVNDDGHGRCKGSAACHADTVRSVYPDTAGTGALGCRAPGKRCVPEPDQQNNVGDYSVLLRKVLGQITF